jgi:hypothetical protein
MYARAEELVMRDFKDKRVHGLCIKKWWLVSCMKMHVKTIYGDTASDSFAASSGWFKRFCARHSITPRRQKNNKSVSTADTLPKRKSTAPTHLFMRRQDWAVGIATAPTPPRRRQDWAASTDAACTHLLMRRQHWAV